MAHDTAPHPEHSGDDDARSAANPHEGSVRETLESIIIAFVLAFMFRAFIVEAFVIPTGSMAPTLLGAHFRADCPMCGYHFTINASAEERQPSGDVNCAMCDYEFNLGVRGALQESGDRILVLKYVYEFSEPRRWDVVVFKNPEDPDQNYIKRLIGLPEEELWLVRGNVFARSLTEDGHPNGDPNGWRIQRKPYGVQQAVWIPVYRSQYFPLDAGEADQRISAERYRPRSRPWHVPWQPPDEQADAWSFQQHAPRWHYEGDGRGVLAFNFDDRYLNNYYAYNSLAGHPGPYGESPVEDMRVGATIIPRQPGLAVTLHAASQRRQFRGVIAADGGVTLQTRPAPRDEPAEPWRTVAEADGRPLPAGRATRAELWHADQRLSLWLDGQRLAEWTYEEDAVTLSQRDLQVVAPTVEIHVANGSATLREVDLDRDIYYTNSTGQGWAAGASEPTVIGPDLFYTLGDNSPASKDSRLWTRVDPWLDHLTDVPVGYVPREMMIGRAFFVYFPAPYRFRDGGPAFVPNFAHMRFIR